MKRLTELENVINRCKWICIGGKRDLFHFLVHAICEGVTRAREKGVKRWDEIQFVILRFVTMHARTFFDIHVPGVGAGVTGANEK